MERDWGLAWALARAAALAFAAVSCGEPSAVPGDPPAGGEPVRDVTAPSAPLASIRLVDEALARGLDHVNASGTPEKDFVLEANGAGVAVLDLAGDGDLDLVFAQGLASLERLASGPGADLEVFANDGTGHFTRAPGPGLAGWWTGLAAGDVDGDGLADLVAGGFGRLVLLVQGADGTFAPAAEILEPGERWIPGARGELPGASSRGAPPWISSLALFDAEGDGDLDLYAGLYLELDPRHPPRGALGEGPLAVPCRWRGHEVFCGPHGLVPQADRLYLWESATEGGGRFADASERLDGLVPAYTLAVATLDVEGDGDTDLYVAVDSMPNSLWINEGGRFVDVGWSAGVAVSSDGAPQAGMGVAVGDVDQNGVLDLAVTNFSGETDRSSTWARSTGFDVGTHRYGLQRETRELLSWSAHLVDLDADGWLELFTTNGHVYPRPTCPTPGRATASRPCSGASDRRRAPPASRPTARTRCCSPRSARAGRPSATSTSTARSISWSRASTDRRRSA